MKLVVCGLGYVGSVSAACLARAGHTVIGVDVNVEKVRQINSGRSPVLEEGLSPLFADVVSSGKLRATTSLAQAVGDADATLICVGTPSRANGSLDTSALEKVCAELGAALANRESRHTVIVRSTVLPGTTRNLLIPILEKAVGHDLDDRLGVCYNPEFMREGTSLADFDRPPFTILGGDDAGHLEVAESLYAGVEAPIERTAIEASEMLKYACNAFHALKVSFANEIGDFASDHGLDGREVMRLLCLDRKLNISPAYMKPGFAFGGSCLPKDLRALNYQARKCDLRLPVLDSILASNREQIQRGLRMIMQSGKKRIGLLGLTFKNGTDDLRESPYVELAESLLGKGYDLKIHDANLMCSTLVGANEAYIQQHVPHFSNLLATLPELIRCSDVVVVCVNNPMYAEALAHCRADQKIVDLAGLKLDNVSVAAPVQGIAW